MKPRITASQLYSHLNCPHRVAMDLEGDPALRDPVSPFVQLLWERGTAHEREVIAGLGMPFLDLSVLSGDAKEHATREAIARREPLIYSGRLSVHELLGEPDLLRLEGGGYVAIDIKSGAGEEGPEEEEDDRRPKKTYGVQIALYTDLLERMGLSPGRYGYIWDVRRHEVRYDLETKLGSRSPSLWELYHEARARVLETLQYPDGSRPALSAACKQCVWRSACYSVLRNSQDLTLLPELGRAKRDALSGEFATVADLAGADVAQYIDGNRTDFPGVGPASLRKFQRRAALQTASRPKPYLTKPVDWPLVDTELFFDIETDPMRDLCYLHGFVIREQGRTGEEQFVGIFASAATPDAERDAFAQAMALFRRHAGALVVHYSKYERTEYRKLARKYPEVATEAEIESLFAQPRALDLYNDVVRPRSEWPTHDFSIKSLARFCGFDWRDHDPSGASSIEWFDQWAKTGDPALRARLLEYNEDDCRAMRVVMDALKGCTVRAG